jgi:BTB/POZ domain
MSSAPISRIKREPFAINFAKGFRDLWSTKKYSDFTIIGGADDKSKEFAVHKCVLGTQSDVFSAVFKNEMKEAQTGKMSIDDFSAVTVEGMLEFLYTGEVNENIAMDLYAIASKYNVTALKEIAEEMVLRNVNESNALEVFDLGHAYGSEEMKKKGFSVVEKMFPTTKLNNDLIKEPAAVKGIVEAHREHKRKIEEAEDEFQVKMMKFNHA